MPRNAIKGQIIRRWVALHLSEIGFDDQHSRLQYELSKLSEKVNVTDLIFVGQGFMVQLTGRIDIVYKSINLFSRVSDETRKTTECQVSELS